MPSLYSCRLATLEVSVGHLTGMKDQSNVYRCRQPFKYSLLSELLNMMFVCIFEKYIDGKVRENICNID